MRAFPDGGAARSSLAILAAVSLAASIAFSPVPAPATGIDDMRAELEAAQEAYNGCQDEISAAEAVMAETESQIAAAETELARTRAELAEQVAWEYRNDPAGFFLEVVCGEKDLASVFRGIERLQAMSEQKARLVASARAAHGGLEAKRAQLEGARMQSEAAGEQAKEIVDSIAPQLEAYESEMRAYYGYHGGGPASAIPESGSVVDYARSRIGCPYVWGGAGDEGFDCSGLVMWAYAQVGISLPHNSEAQYAAADEVVPLSEARPGDVLWRSGHVGICTGYGASSYVHAPDFGCFVREGDPAGWSGFSCALRFNR